MEGELGAIDRDAALAIQRRAFRDFIEFVARSSAGALVIERHGVAASIVPACPQRSVPNSVIYKDGEALRGSLDDLASAYEQAGIAAWTVWCPDFDRETSAALEAAGHKLDGRPGAMVLELDRLAARDPGDLVWDNEVTAETYGRLNDEAYGHLEGDGYAPAFQRIADGLDLHLYQARIDGEPACVLGTIDHAPTTWAAGPDCGVYFVATAPAHQGRGLASRLLAIALLAARERGCATSSLQASPAGEPVYERLGYRTYFRFHMYERRR